MQLAKNDIRCGKCGNRHRFTIQVRACYGFLSPDGPWPCSWMMEVALATGDPHEPYYQGIIECGAPTYLRPDGTGYDCELGHEHTYEQARQTQGWDYASDAGEAALLAKYGTEPREMDGHVWAGPLPFA
jgi:hypothetical protein